MELQEYLDEVQPVESGFTVDTEEKANWALRKIRQFKDKAEANKKLAQAEIGRIEEWLGKENNALSESIAYFEGLLQQYAEKQKETDPKFKSLKLPYGKIRYKKQQPEYLRDDEKLLTFLEANQMTDFIKVKKSADWAGLKGKVKVNGDIVIYEETGEIIPGVTVVERPDKFEVETEG